MPQGKGGRGLGRGQGVGYGRGQGRGGGNRPGSGPGGLCVCPNCGATVPHQRGVPCNTVHCPKCNSTMLKQ